MSVRTKSKHKKTNEFNQDQSKVNAHIFSKDYVDFLNEAGWRLEKRFPSNSNDYSDLLEDTDWTCKYSDLNTSKHYRRDLDALS